MRVLDLVPHRHDERVRLLLAGVMHATADGKKERDAKLRMGGRQLGIQPKEHLAVIMALGKQCTPSNDRVSALTTQPACLPAQVWHSGGQCHLLLNCAPWRLHHQLGPCQEPHRCLHCLREGRALHWRPV